MAVAIAAVGASLNAVGVGRGRLESLGGSKGEEKGLLIMVSLDTGDRGVAGGRRGLRGAHEPAARTCFR